MSARWIYPAMLLATLVAIEGVRENLATAKHVRALQATADSLRALASAEADSAARVDTVRVTTIKRIPAVDAATKPPPACLPSLAVRDTVIKLDSAEIKHWRQAYADEHQAADSLRRANQLLTRSFQWDILQPRVQVSLQAMVFPEQRIGIGISIPLASFKPKNLLKVIL